MTVAEDAAAAELLHALGYLYLRGGETGRSLAFLLLACRVRPDDAGILRTLAAAFVADGAGGRALGVVERLAGLENSDSPDVALLRARALRAAGRLAEARRCFKTYVEMRKEG